MTLDMFEQDGVDVRKFELYGEDIHILHGFALQYVDDIMPALTHQIKPQSPLCHMTTPCGYSMSVGMTNCGQRGWVTLKCTPIFAQHP
jgi:alkylated DNA repair protein (DNA oxidative demethylase)